MISDARKRANENWAADNPRKMIGFRVTPEAKKVIDDYMTKKAAEENESHPDKRKYTTALGRPSVAVLLQRLLEDEIGVDLMPETK